ncbi:MAG TPA: molybdate ABC transporter permease subunit [Persephonella sp.]|nr:molybdate ABC transporter permease subunit [Hydrogenothermaceae bacterium]HIQ25686.1 molybdate ABC transporter permease subunit [Persephonella sp.]
MESSFVETLYITFKLAFITTVLLLFIGFPIAILLAFKNFKLKTFFEAVIALPLVLPPTVLGFYFLVLLGKINLAFTFEGLVIASIVYSLPFMVQPIHSALISFPKDLIEASYTLGKSQIETFFKVIAPNIKSSIITAIVLTFAHTVGEFGVVLMVGGSIPGETKVASIAIYEEVEALNYSLANKYALVLIIVSFITIFLVYLLNKRITELK